VAVPEDVLAEGSGPVPSVDKDAVATVDDVVTTDDVATTDDVVVTPDDIVATTGASEGGDDGDPAGSDESPDAGGASAEAPSSRGKASRSARKGQKRGRGGKLKPAVEAPQAVEPETDEATAQDRGAQGGGDESQIARGGDAGDGNEAAGDVPTGRDGMPRYVAADSDGVPREVSDGSDDESRDPSYGSDRELRDPSDGSDRELRDALENGEVEVRAVPPDEPEDGGGSDESRGEGEGEGEGNEEGAVVFPASAANMDAAQFKHLVEALIFASDRPLTVQRLRQLTRVGDVRRLEHALTELTEDYRERGVVLQQVSGGYQFRTRTQFSAWVQQLIAGRPVRLSRAQLETLAIIAYRQPITRPEIDDIRGVDSSATLKLLMDRMLIRVLGKREEVGRPMLYGTTKEFLDFFSLGDLRELPTLREYSELTAESRKVMSERLGIPADGSDGSGDGGEGGTGGDSGSGGPGHGDGGDGGDGPMGGGSAPGFGDGGGLVDDSAPSASSDASAGAAAAFWAAAAAVDRSETAALADLEAEREATTLAHVSLDLGDDGEGDDPEDDGEPAALVDGDAEGMVFLEQTEAGGSPELEVEPAQPGEADAPAAVALEADDALCVAADADIEGDDSTAVAADADLEGNDSTAVAADADRDAALQGSAPTADRLTGDRFGAAEAAEPITTDGSDAVGDVAEVADADAAGADAAVLIAPTESDAALEAPALDDPHAAAMIEEGQGSSRYRAGIGESATDARTGSVLHPAASYESPIQDGLVDAPRGTTQIDPTLE